MPPSPLPLNIAVGTYGHTTAIKEGAIRIEGTAPQFANIVNIIAAFRRMVREVAFDVCEMAATTYCCARAYGAPYKALPILLVRNFHFKGLVCRPDANIRAPKDLEGKKVGVRAYSVTTGVWLRGVLMNEYGLDASKVTWVVDDEEHVTQLKLPSNVVHAPAGQSLRDLMESGEIQAAYTGGAGLGRQGAPKEGTPRVYQDAPNAYHELIPDAAQQAVAWYKRTGIYPMHGVLVVKDELLKAHPWLAHSLFNAFNTAKTQYLERLHSGQPGDRNDKRYRDFSAVVGPDPLPYGIEANLPTIEALIKYATQQRLLPRAMSVDDLFVNLDA